MAHFEKRRFVQREGRNADYSANTPNRQIGFMFQNANDYPRAIEYYSKGLSFSEQIKDKKGIGSSLINIATVYNLSGISEALEHTQRALVLFRELDIPENIATALGNMGIILINWGFKLSSWILIKRQWRSTKMGKKRVLVYT